MLLLCSVAQAEIVYVDIDDYQVGPAPLNGSPEVFLLDVDGNGIDDLSFSHVFEGDYYAPYGGSETWLDWTSSVTATGASGVISSPMSSGNTIGSGGSFMSSAGLGDYYYYELCIVFPNPPEEQGCDQSYSDYGNWQADTVGFLGIEIVDGGLSYFGWVQLQIGSDNASVTIIDYAYENVAGRSIAAGSVIPVPAAIWLFGSALAGLGWLRRK